MGELKFRDEFEFELISYAIKKDLALLGVCRGLQVISNYFGGSLKRVKNQVAIKHTLHVESSSKYKELLCSLDLVNSYHNFAIDRLGDGLIVSAKDENGNIKAIEHKSYKIFAQMWHSEREKPFKKSEIEIVKRVLKI